MAKLRGLEKEILEDLFQMQGGYVLNFSDRTMGEFFRDEMGIDIYSSRYNYLSGSKANRIRAFWMKEDEELIGRSILKLIEYIEVQLLLNKLNHQKFTSDRIVAAKNIAEKLLGGTTNPIIKSRATFKDGSINIILQKDIFDHVQKLLDDGHHFTAVEEAYKIVRKKLEDITGKEKATDAFAESNIEKIFGHKPRNGRERDFFEGVKFLHMSIQFLRNEKVHTPAEKMDKNLAIHYIVLASLAYDLITRNSTYVK